MVWISKTVAFQPTMGMNPAAEIDRRVQHLLDDGWMLVTSIYDTEMRTAYYTFVRKESSRDPKR